MELAPKEKAKELINSYLVIYKDTVNKSFYFETARQCSLLCVSEIQRFGGHLNIREPMMYWGMVSKELKKMKVSSL